jgi:hypothetical protein
MRAPSPTSKDASKTIMAINSNIAETLAEVEPIFLAFFFFFFVLVP